MFHSCRQSPYRLDPTRSFPVRALAVRTVFAGTAFLLLGNWCGPTVAIAQQPPDALSQAKVAPPAAAASSQTSAAGEGSSIPDFQAIQSELAKHFASLEGLQVGDLLSQSQIDGALDVVHDAGWDVPDRKSIVERALPDGSFMVKQLRTPAGLKFMRRVARHPGAYNRLDRLSTIAGGQALIRDLIHQKDGDKLLEYLTTTPGGQRMGRMASNVQRGVDLNKSTARIYTADDLLGALARLYPRDK
jgi:hypothetical protein